MKCHLDEAQAGIKISRRSINYLRHADDTTLMAESKEELRLLVRVKEESERTFLKFNMKKVTNLASGTINFRANRTGKMKGLTAFIFLVSKITADDDCNHEMKRCLFFGWKVMTNLDSILKNQRHHFADKGPYSQSYCFSRSHV